MLVYLYVGGQRVAEAEAALLKDPEWAAPLLWRSEFCNTLTGLVRRQALALPEALRILDVTERAMTGREYSVPSLAVVQLAVQSGCSAYDCEFVALARDLGVPLVTVDRELLRAFPAVAVTPAAFARPG